MKIICLMLCAFLLLTFCACAKQPVQEPPAPATQAQIPAQETPEAEEPSENPAREESMQEAIEDPDWHVDTDMLTDAYLLDIVLSGELALTHGNSFTFSDPTELSSQELYMLFLMYSDYAALERDCLDPESGEFTFTEEYISAQLSRYFQDFNLDITQISNYNAEKNAVVTTQASGFGGDRFTNIVEKKIDGNLVTLTLDFYDNYEKTGDPYQRKTYRLAFYDGGFYFLSAVVG